MASKLPKAEDEGFESVYRKLEETVSKLEEGGLTLNESLSLYEAGMQLASRCQELLQEAELKVTRLQESFSGGLNSAREEAVEYTTELETNSRDELPLE